MGEVTCNWVVKRMAVHPAMRIYFPRTRGQECCVHRASGAAGQELGEGAWGGLDCHSPPLLCLGGRGCFPSGRCL